ncbi:MAG TPA: cupin domain-containing protein [Blastocatellia bacterium]|nr:cupin domain-containing protein [Blastocatellia bacterium]
MINNATAEHYKWGSDCDGWHLLKRDDLSVIEEQMPPGTSEVKHYHQRSRQFFFVLSGILTIQFLDSTETLRQFEGVEISPGTQHQVLNNSGEDVRFLVISQPRSHGDRVLV